jgi:hypothetical protein
MRLDNLQDTTFSDICSRFPLKPIKDDGSYRAAIEILGRLFMLDGPRTPAELEYFQMLADFAYEYESDESKTNIANSQTFYQV